MVVPFTVVGTTNNNARCRRVHPFRIIFIVQHLIRLFGLWATPVIARKTVSVIMFRRASSFLPPTAGPPFFFPTCWMARTTVWHNFHGALESDRKSQQFGRKSTFNPAKNDIGSGYLRLSCCLCFFFGSKTCYFYLCILLICRTPRVVVAVYYQFLSRSSFSLFLDIISLLGHYCFFFLGSLSCDVYAIYKTTVSTPT